MSRKKKVDTRHLMHAVCPLSVIPVRVRPDEGQPMISQMLFGETCEIIEKKNKHWCRVITHQCGVTGWVRTLQLQLADEKECTKLRHQPAIALEICSPVLSEDTSLPIVAGSCLPCFDGMSCRLPDKHLIYNGQAALYGTLDFGPDLFVKLARRYLHSPELQGGRSPFGLDGAALVQLVYRFFSIPLPRYAPEQFALGEPVDFVELAVEGDIAFFQNDEGQIIHSGLIVGEKRILHVHGQVRIDKIDHHGIFHNGLVKYTHTLRMIRRILPTATGQK